MKPGQAGTEALVVGRDAGGGQRAHGDAVVGHLAGEDLDLVRLALAATSSSGRSSARSRSTPRRRTVNWKWFSGPGKSPASRVASSIGGGEARPKKLGTKATSRICAAAASASSRPAVADVDVPQTGEGVDVALAVGVPEEDVFAAHHDEGTVVAQGAQVRDRMQQVRLVLRDELGGVPRLYDGHVPSPSLVLPRRSGLLPPPRRLSWPVVARGNDRDCPRSRMPQG